MKKLKPRLFIGHRIEVVIRERIIFISITNRFRNTKFNSLMFYAQIQFHLNLDTYSKAFSLHSKNNTFSEKFALEVHIQSNKIGTHER